MGVTSPPLQIVAVAYAVDLHHLGSLGVVAGRCWSRGLSVGSVDDSRAVGRPGKVLHSPGRAGELPRFAAMGRYHPYLARLAGTRGPQKGQDPASGRKAGTAVGMALGEFPLSESPGLIPGSTLLDQ